VNATAAVLAAAQPQAVAADQTASLAQAAALAISAAAQKGTAQAVYQVIAQVSVVSIFMLFC
jgi:hypothetical protein